MKTVLSVFRENKKQTHIIINIIIISIIISCVQCSNSSNNSYYLIFHYSRANSAKFDSFGHTALTAGGKINKYLY